MTLSLFTESHGNGEPTLLLLHGLGVNGAVWQAMLAQLSNWPGRIVIPDLRGHGRSPHARHYAYGHHAADVAALLAPGERTHVVGHSMGGAIGLVLANGLYGIKVESVLGFGMKVDWPPEELQKLAQVARTPARWFDSRREAADRFLRVSGLAGQADDNASVVTAGLVEEGGRYRLAADTATVLAAGPDIGPMLRAATAPVRLACGSRDPLTSIAALRRYDPAAIELARRGHNLQVEAPEELARLIMGIIR